MAKPNSKPRSRPLRSAKSDMSPDPNELTIFPTSFAPGMTTGTMRRQSVGGGRAFLQPATGSKTGLADGTYPTRCSWRRSGSRS
jgi:hypothetical protein